MSDRSLFYIKDSLDEKEVFSNGLNSLFSYSQLRLIEIAFERGLGAFKDYDYNLEPSTKRAAQFGRKFKTEKSRLRAIMKNIVENKGTFIP